MTRASGFPEPITDNSPLRSGKGSLYEGGVRVPLLIRWPGLATPNAICSEPVILTDLFATCMNAAGLELPAGTLDGMDLAPLLKNPREKLERDALFFHYPHYYHTTTPVGAIRAREWKLLEYFEDNRVELFNLGADMGERRDLAQQLPKKAAELSETLRNWRQNVDAAMPRPNPQFKSEK